MKEALLLSGMKSVQLPAKQMVMSFHPITNAFSEQIEKICGPVDRYYNAAELRKSSLPAALRELRRLQTDKLIIALETDAGRALIGPLSIAASFTQAKSIEVIWPDLRVEPVYRLGAVRQVGQSIYDTLSSRRALARSMRAGTNMRRMAMPRAVPPSVGKGILYLDANISLGTSVGGSIGHTAGVIDGFLQHGFEVDYASLKPIPTDRTGARWLKLEPESLLAIPPELNFYKYADVIERKITIHHRASPWSFIYQRFSLHNFIGPRLGRKLNIPVVMEYNGSEAWAAENWGTKLALHDAAIGAESTALGSADLLVTVSDQLAYDLKRRGIPDSRIVVYPNCVDSDTFDTMRFTSEELGALRDQYKIPRDALVAGFIGTFGQWHGVEFLAGCIRHLVEENAGWLNSKKLHFMLVGDGLKMPLVQKILGEGVVSRYVTLTGLVAQADAPKYLATSDLLISPHVPNTDGSEFFGSPTKLFEYMAMEKPIVASALGQIGEVISGQGATKLGTLPPGSGRTGGFLFEPGDALGFENMLQHVVNDMPKALKVAQAARVEVLNRYTWKHHVEAILDRMKQTGLLARLPDRPLA
jgi:glycosyltransferase involved in cell wall biosynthesis